MVVLLRGDGILITFEGKKLKDEVPKAETVGESFPSFTSIHLSSCAYWNLIDPTLEGKVVLLKGPKIKLAVTYEKDLLIELQINGKNNYKCPNLETRSEIVLFYKDPKIKDDEQHGLIKALPGCIVSEIFDISRSLSYSNSREIETVSSQILELDPIKVAVLLCSDRLDRRFLMANFFSQHDKVNCVCRYPIDYSDRLQNNRGAALLQICALLKNLSEKTPNFRELSIEALDSDFDMAFVDLVRELKLTTLRCFNLKYPYCLFQYLNANNHHVNAKLLKACSQNEFMRNNLNYLDLFPMLLLTNSEAKIISKLLFLKKIALFYINDSGPESLYKEVTPLQVILEQNLYLQEVELFFGDNYCFISERDLLHISKVKLSRFSILGISKECQSTIKKVFEISDQKNLLDWIKSAKSIYVSWLHDFKSHSCFSYCRCSNNQSMLSWILSTKEGKFVNDTQVQKNFAKCMTLNMNTKQIL